MGLRAYNLRRDAAGSEWNPKSRQEAHQTQLYDNKGYRKGQEKSAKNHRTGPNGSRQSTSWVPGRVSNSPLPWRLSRLPTALKGEHIETRCQRKYYAGLFLKFIGCSMKQPQTLLVVNDHPDMQDFLDSMSDDHAWNVETVQSASEALKLIQRDSYGLVLTGLGSSWQNDIELLRQMRQVRPHLKLIILTQQSTPSAVLASIRAHAFSHFSGPFDPRSLTEMIERALQELAWDDGIDVIAARPEWIVLQLKCRMTTVERVLQFMEELRAELPDKERHEIGTAFREMLLNAIEYGGKFDPEQYVEVSRICTTHAVIYIIRDPGEGFSFSSLPHSAVSNTADEPFAHVGYREQHGMRPGGFGILLTKGLVDELLYSERGNEVFMIKNLTITDHSRVPASAGSSESSVGKQESSLTLDSGKPGEVASQLPRVQNA